METKECTKCKLEKTIESFAWKVLNIKRSYVCKACQKIYRDAHYRKDPKKWKDNALKNRAKRKDLFKKFKSSLKCNRCPQSHPATLQFHHTNPNEKEMGIAAMVHRGLGLNKIKEEIKKCEILCANCHAEHHWGEFF